MTVQRYRFAFIKNLHKTLITAIYAYVYRMKIYTRLQNHSVLLYKYISSDIRTHIKEKDTWVYSSLHCILAHRLNDNNYKFENIKIYWMFSEYITCIWIPLNMFFFNSTDNLRTHIFSTGCILYPTQQYSPEVLQCTKRQHYHWVQVFILFE